MAERTPKPRLLSHVDIRVRDRARAVDFYDNLLGVLGARRVHDDDPDAEWTSYAFVDPDDPHAPVLEWFGFTVDAAMVPGSTRIAFAVPTRGMAETVGALLPSMGALEIEGPDDDYHAYFFSDPDGNKLEVLYRPDRAQRGA